MTNEELIRKYLDRFFYVSILNKGLRSTDAGIISFLDLVENKHYEEYALLTHLYVIFGRVLNLSNVFDEWKKNTIKKFAGDFQFFLDDCVLTLGHTEWEIRHKKFGVINLNALNTYHTHNYNIDVSMMRALFNQWYDEKIYDASEKMMKGL